MRYWTILCVLLTLGCEDGVRSKAPPRGAEPLGEWAFAPASVRVHPFTVLTHTADGESYTLDARVELLDPLGDATKGVGTFRAELYSQPAGASRAQKGQRMEMWEVGLLTLQENKAHYDTITRMYRFRLQLANPPPSRGDLWLYVTFSDTRGHRLTAEMDLGEKPEKEQ